jgi:hypothetical protein
MAFSDDAFGFRQVVRVLQRSIRRPGGCFCSREKETYSIDIDIDTTRLSCAYESRIHDVYIQKTIQFDSYLNIVLDSPRASSDREYSQGKPTASLSLSRTSLPAPFPHRKIRI